MSFKTINKANWNRLKHFSFFNHFDYPHFNICANVDITELRRFAKEKESDEGTSEGSIGSKGYELEGVKSGGDIAEIIASNEFLEQMLQSVEGEADLETVKSVLARAVLEVDAPRARPTGSVIDALGAAAGMLVVPFVRCTFVKARPRARS